MNAKNSNYYDMFIRVQSVLDNHAATWENNPFMVKQKEALDARLTQLDEMDSKLVEYQSAKAITKTRLKAELQEKLQDLQGILLIYATLQRDDDLQKNIGNNRNTITTASDKKLRALSDVIIEEADELQDTLPEFGYTAEELATVKQLHADYAKLVGQPLADMNEFNAFKRDVKRETQATNALIRKQLDRVMLSYRKRDERFYDAYTLARTIIDRKVRLKKEEESPVEGSSESGIPPEG